MKSQSIPALVSLIVCGSTPIIGCSYEPPQVNPTSGAGGSSSSSSSGQGGSAGQGVGGQSNTGGQGGSGICDPGPTAVECSPYTGPTGTQGVGTCHASTKTCSTNGTWTACSNEVLPVPEGCTGAKDDTNCDGRPPCSGTAIPSSSAPFTQTTADDVILSTAAGILSEAGAVYAVGTQGGILNPQPANNLRVLFWYRDPAGQTHDWSNKFQFVANGGTNGAAASGVTVLGDSGDVIVAGIFYGGVLTIENNQPVTAGPVTTTFIARLSSTGAVLSASFSEGPGALETTAIASDANGNVYIGGNYSGTPVIDKVALPLSLGQDGFVARISKDGGYKWHQVFSGLGPQNVSAIAAFGNNDIAVATTFVGAMDVITMGGPKTYDALGSPDILVSRLNGGDGTALWNTQIRTPSGGNLEVGGLAANATTIALAGRFIGNIDLSIANYTNSEATGTFDSFLAILPTADGIATKSMASQAIGTQEIRSVAFDSFGDIVLGGAFSISLPLQDMMLQTTTGPDAFVAKFSPDLSTRWVQQFGADFYQGSYSVVVEHRNGNVFAGGGFEGNLTGTNPVLSSAGKLDAFLIELNN